MASGIELATEWVTIIPETAMLVKKLKEFKPPPISVPLKVESASRQVQSNIVKPVEKAGQQAGKALTATLTRGGNEAGKATGEAVAGGIGGAQAGVRNAAKKLGGVLRGQAKEDGEKAGKESTEAMAKGIDKAKAAVARAERSVADARRNEANIDSRIRAQEEKIQQYRMQTARLADVAAQEERRANQLRANSEKNTADIIEAQEQKALRARQQHAAMVTRLGAAEEANGRLVNTRESATSRTANAVDRLTTAEAALAAAVAGSKSPLEDQENKTNRGTSAFGKMTSSLIPLGKQLLLTTGLFTGAMGIGGAITSVLRQGNQFQESMNVIKGITQASGEEMAQISDKAKALGRDFTLPATSASDAAAAMLELTRAGFTVQQAMDAARGALQLSASAGVTAAEAAKVTGTTLNAFSLKATDAAHVTDVLANAANLFPGEMTDFAYSLSQGGAVAKTFGISLEDTTTALGLLAKAGIKSSDAGTLIKTMLLSLTDQGKPAQAAIKTLGLQLYDAQGKFKGLDYVYKRLNQSSKELTQEQYQAAVATLFGSDAARFAGIAADGSADQWDSMRKAMDRAGTAADVANARLEGLPGAMQKLKNAGEDLALTIYQAIAPSLTNIVTTVAKVVEAFTTWLRTAGIGTWLKEHKDLLLGLGAGLATYVGIIGTVKAATAAWTAAQWALDLALNANPISLIIMAIAALVAGIVYAYFHFKTFRNIVDAVGRAIKTAWVAAMPVVQTVFKAIGTAALWVWHNVLEPLIDFLASTWPYAWSGMKFAWAVGKQVFEEIKATVLWLWHNILEPAWEAIKVGWKLLWTWWQLQWVAGKAVFLAVADVAKWLWHTILEPAWEGIKAGAELMWEGIKAVFNFFKAGFDALGEGAMWLWHNIFEPVWEAIKAGFQAVWDFLKPIFDKIGDAFKVVGDIAKTIGQGIKDAWNGVLGVIKAPIHAIGSILVGIPDEILGIRIDFAGDIRGWGKTLQGLATGGITSAGVRNHVLFGPGTGTSDSILGLDPKGMPTARVSAGEGVVPEKALATPLGQMLFALLIDPSFQSLPGLKGGGRSDGLNPGAGYLSDVIKKLFPQVTDIGGRRSEDGFGEHSSGNAIDIMIPNWQTPEGLALGNQIAGFLATNATRLGLNGMIWQQKSYGYGGSFSVGKPMADRGDPNQNHYTHIHAILGSGRGANAQAVGLPSGPLLAPQGGRFGGSMPGGMYSAAGFGGGSSSGYTGGSGGSGVGDYGNQVDPKKVREAQDRVTDRENQLRLAQERLDEYLAKQQAGKDVKQSTIDSAQNQVDKFTRELEEAKSDLETAQRGKPGRGSRSGRGAASQQQSGGTDWSQVGKMIFSGFMEEIGLDGSFLKNPFEFPNVKSGMAALNFGLGLLMGGQDQSGGSGGLGDMSGLDAGLGGGMGALGGVISGIGEPMGIQAMQPGSPAPQDQGGGDQGGVTFDMRGSNLGVAPSAFSDQITNITAASRRHPVLATQGNG